jgi:hypothetical protein
LLAGIFLLTFLRIKADREDFKLISRFAAYGLIGGAIGFGAGSYWLVLGKYMPPDMYFRSWWKMMEFSFGFILGGSLGYAAWKSKSHMHHLAEQANFSFTLPRLGREIAAVVALAVVIYVLIPLPIEYYLDKTTDFESGSGQWLRQAGRIIVNFVFLGCALILFSLRNPYLLWQSAITITFCHTAIDFVRDLKPENEIAISIISLILFVVITTLIVGYLTAVYQRGKRVKLELFLLLTWSCMLPAYLKLLSARSIWYPEAGDPAFMQRVGQAILAHLPVHAIFTVSALIITWMAFKTSKTDRGNQFPEPAR